ncbi:transposase [Thermococcus sp. 21S9]|uniref:transposase n=1 Tax=Thermococcus sp. 21S9 TaxID=1638223 RepID=UPI00143AD554|nr:transposase [Thermococcus sp. 21S9]NJE53865.1 transposase [Thermococcus sp. 21S9]
MRRKLEVLVFLAVVLMMYLYPLSIVPLLLLAREWEEFREEWKKSALFIGLSIPLYGAKIALGISGWAKTLGITPVHVSSAVWWAVYLAFTALQTLAVYYVYRVGKGLGDYARTGGLVMLIAVPLHLLSLKLYFILTWTGLLLFLLGLEKRKEVIG